MSAPAPIRDVLLSQTAGYLGNDYLQQLLSKLAGWTKAELALMTQRAPGSHQHMQILHSNHADLSGDIPLAGNPCARVYDSGEALLIEEDLNLAFANTLGSDWQSFAAWPLLDDKLNCIGHLALFGKQRRQFSPALIPDVEPFVCRAAAELQQLQLQQKQAQRQHWQMMHSDILRQNAEGKPLPALMVQIVKQIEQAFGDWQCSIQMLDEQGRMQPCACDSLPPAYTRQTAGLMPGPMVGSCGAAIWHGKRIIAENLQQHPNWAPYRELAAHFGLGSCWSEPLIDSKGKVHGTFAVYHHQPATPSPQAITILEDTARLLALLVENHDVHRALDSRTQWYRAILQNAADALAIISMDGRFLEASDSLCRMLEVSPQELETLHLWDFTLNMDPKTTREQLQKITPQAHTFETSALSRSGRSLCLEVSVRRLQLDDRAVIWGSARDIKQRKALQMALEKQATTDSLTGLYNRQTLFTRLETLMQLASVQQAPLSVLMLDMDHFKGINDCYGHHAGDLVLAELGETLRETLREIDSAGRFGGEEFCLLLPGLTLADAMDVAERIVDDVGELRIQSGQHMLSVTCSIGVACLDNEDDSNSLLARADQALYQAKAAGRHCAVSLPPLF